MNGENKDVSNDIIYGVKFEQSEINDLLNRIGFIDMKFIPNRLCRSPFLHDMVIAKKPI